MLSRLVSGGLLGALAGAAMLVVASGPSSAFTLSSPSLERPVATAGIQKVYYYYRRYYRRPYTTTITIDRIIILTTTITTIGRIITITTINPIFTSQQRH